ncbi:hypothetical protein PTKIN_Ptkin10aG0029100 [Pterospermum kingtungense]
MDQPATFKFLFRTRFCGPFRINGKILKTKNLKLFLETWHFLFLEKNDQWVWKSTQKGNYTVSIAYRLITQNNNVHDIGNWRKETWRTLWSLKIPTKIIIFLWKICNDCLPTKAKLHSLIDTFTPICPMCEQENETTEHLFLLCPFARAVWFGSDLTIRMDLMEVTSLKDWIKSWLEKPLLT